MASVSAPDWFLRQHKVLPARAGRSKVVPRKCSALVLVRLYPAGRERFLLAGEAAEPKERKIYLEKNIRLRGQIELEEDLHKTLTLISSKWKMQNNRKDQQTGFIYRTQSLEECLR